MQVLAIPQRRDPGLWKPVGIVVGSLSLFGVMLPIVLFLAAFFVFALPFVIPFMLYESEHELMADLAPPKQPHLRWAGPMPHPETL
jgi:hypothetical protein